MAYTPGEATPLLGPSSAGPSSKILSETKVYPLIHLIRVDIMAHIDAPLTYEQLLAPESTYTIVRPLTEKYLELQNQSAVFCLLLNKIQFTRDSNQLSISSLSTARANLCEILAIRVLRGWSERSLPLATVLLTPWALFQGASEEVLERAREEGDDELVTQGGTALEMAIISGSKRFIRSPSCQKVIEGIWSGRIIYSALNTHALIADNYKKKPIQMYNPHKAPLLDHYRLKVPRVRSMMEYVNFLVLFTLYVVAIEGLDENRLNGRELAFIIYALAFSLDKLAAIREHGLKVFSSSLVNGFDLLFMVIYAVYLGARTYGFHYHDQNALELGSDWLAIGAVLIFPRLAFVTLANNLMVLSIRSMLTEFFFLMSVGFFCFLGFLYALFTLGQGQFALSQIGWWLLEVYFGLDASGFEHAHVFHPFLGPVLMVSYALLSNTLLLTVLVAILGNTFATINADAAAESMFRKAVSTLEGVKADAVFSYQLPFNLVAVVVMWPMSYILGPRWFHKVNVTMIRVSSLPILLVIALYERQSYREQTLMEQLGDFAERYVGNLPRKLKAAAGFDNFGNRRDIESVFEIEREVGDFYRGWDDDVFEESDFHLPPPIDSTSPSSSSDEAEEDGAKLQINRKLQNGSAPNSATPTKLMFTDSAAMTASPSGLEHDLETGKPPSEGVPSPKPRKRTSSMPSQPKSPHIDIRPRNQSNAHAQAHMQAQGPMTRPRRNSSMQIHGPSPLAQLFMMSPESDRGFHNRRNSMAGMALSSSHPALSSVLGPNRRQRTILQQPPATQHVKSGSEGDTLSLGKIGEVDMAAKVAARLNKRGRPEITPIIESRQASFSGAHPTLNLEEGRSEGSITPTPTISKGTSAFTPTASKDTSTSSATTVTAAEPYTPSTLRDTKASNLDQKEDSVLGSAATIKSNQSIPFPELYAASGPSTTRSVRFPGSPSITPNNSNPPTRSASPSNSTLRIPSSSGGPKSPRPNIIKASQVENMQLGSGRPEEELSTMGMDKRLEGIEKRQRRIEEMLERLCRGMGEKDRERERGRESSRGR
ncbi:hypothetical protein I302_101566 [Kwoniella bestiolae CBS 10118]|uniref:Receptor-activated Ca2+-permeable cation channel n=1 Tax=Kwoniella bestiolae CBS 10118 TaxID=1296100 RepID=A0A1B9GCL2_9TREE|nr:hypothetical protein I302_00249 [Kwoniella bestiolae CBS 10118]OCF28760.1 hypothetical protein I302_00249 [Kwoniella bestiolae CBS 10118]